MIEWYKDDEYGIYFSIVPNLKIRYATNLTSLDEVNDINKKPFINAQDIEVLLFDYISSKEYQFKIKKGYKWDGATIPRIFWNLIGSRTDSRFLVPSFIHDVLCENHNYVDYDRYFADKIFERLLFVSKVNPVSRLIIFHSVDNFQKFCKW